jgi:glutathione S-transferase
MDRTPQPATLYVILGSHACRTAMLTLEHKRIPYRTVELLTGPHPFSVRARGFAGHRAPIRSVDGGTHRTLAGMDRLGTVPALRYGDQKIQTNLEITRFLERIQPQPPLLPADPAERQAVEQAERWGNDVLQMTARRIVLAGGLHGLDAFHARANAGRLGPLLARNESIRAVSNWMAARLIFGASTTREQDLLAQLPALLDTVDRWIDAGVLNGATLNAADLMIAPSLALLAYRRDLRPQIDARPAGELLRRVLPVPAGERAAAATGP